MKEVKWNFLIFLRVNNDSINFVCTNSYDFAFLIYIHTLFFIGKREVEQHEASLVSQI
jgi:hypothetical protein